MNLCRIQTQPNGDFEDVECVNYEMFDAKNLFTGARKSCIVARTVAVRRRRTNKRTYEKNSKMARIITVEALKRSQCAHGRLLYG